MNRCFLQDKFCCRELYEADRASTRKKHPSGGWEGLILAFIVCVSSVNGGMAPGEMEIIFATEYGFRMCSPFRLGSRGERRSSQKFLFPTQRRRPVTSVRDECDERSSFENSDLRTTLQCPCCQFGCSKLWVVIALRRQEKSEEKNILRSLRSNKLFLQLTSPRVGWVG